MNLGEISRTVAHCRTLIVSGIEAVSGFPLRALDGSAAAPTYSFTNDTTTGVYTSNGRDVAFAAGGTTSFAVDQNANVSLAGDEPVSTPAFGGGEAVVYFNQVSVVPTTAPNGGSGGGALFVDGISLKFIDETGTIVNLTNDASDVVGPATATDNTLAKFDSTTGKLIAEATGMTLTYAPNAMTVPTGGVAAAPTYSFISATTTGFYNSAAGVVGLAVGGVEKMQIGTDVTLTVPLTVPVGSAATPTIIFTSTGDGLFGKVASGVSTLGFSGGGVSRMSVDNRANVALVSPVPSNFGGGEGVVYIGEATVAPTGAVTAGVGLYVEGDHLKVMRATSATPVTLSDGLTPAVTGTDNAVVRIAGGDSLKDSPNTLISDAGSILASGGTVGAPAYSFAGDTTTGFYNSAANTLGVAIGGVETLSLGTAITVNARLLAASGTVGAPGVSWVGNTDTGFFLNGGNTLAVSINGVAALGIHPSLNTSLCGLAPSVGGGAGIIYITQATVDPTISPTNMHVMYVTAADADALAIRLSTGGAAVPLAGRVQPPASSTTSAVVRWVDATAIQNSSVTTDATTCFGVDGTVNTPTFSFVAEPDTGLAFVGGTTLSVIVDSVAVVQITDTQIVTPSVRVPDGTAAAPSIINTSDTGYGMFLPAANTLAVVAGASAVSIVTTLTNTSGNVTLCASGTGYGDGEGVVLIGDVTTAPTTTSTNTGRLFADGTDLKFHNDTGATIVLNDFLAVPPSTTVNTLVRFTGTSGELQSTTGIFRDASSNISIPSIKTKTDPNFAFSVPPSTGLYFPTSTSLALTTVDTDRVVMDDTAVAVTEALVFAQNTSTLTVNGGYVVTNGTTYTFDADVVSGTFSWTRDGVEVLSTTAARNLRVANDLLFTTGDPYTYSHDGATAFKIGTYTETGYNQVYSHAGTPVITIQSTRLDVPADVIIAAGGRVYNAPEIYTYGCLLGANNRGLGLFGGKLQMQLGSSEGCVFDNSHNIRFGVESTDTISDGCSGVMFIGTKETGSGPTQVTINLDLTTHNGVETHGTTTTGLICAGMHCAVTSRAALSIPSDAVADTLTTGTAGTWTVEHEYGVTGANTGAIASAGEACYVLFTVDCTWTTNATGFRQLSIVELTSAPATVVRRSVNQLPPTTFGGGMTVSWFGPLPATSSLAVAVRQNSGGNLNVNINISYTRMTTN